MSARCQITTQVSMSALLAFSRTTQGELTLAYQLKESYYAPSGIKVPRSAPKESRSSTATRASEGRVRSSGRS